MADEPTGNPNSKQGEEIMILFKQLNNKGVTIMQVTHSEKMLTYLSFDDQNNFHNSNRIKKKLNPLRKIIEKK